MNNHVEVGDSNTGNICGGDLNINSILPCKNCSSFLSFDDYQDMPYCNVCIDYARTDNLRRYQVYAYVIGWVISIIVVGSVWLLTGHLPNFINKDTFVISYFSPILSTLMIIMVVLLFTQGIARVLGSQYNDSYYSLHE